MGDEEDRDSDDAVDSGALPIDRGTARQLVSALRAAGDTNRDMAILQERVVQIQEEVRKHRRALYEGNGKSIVSRLDLIESHTQGRAAETTADRSGRWAVWAALVSGVCGLAAAVVALLK